MIFDYWLAGIVTAGTPRLPHLRPAQAREVLRDATIMTLNGWIQIAIYCVHHRGAGEAARLVHGGRLQRRAHLSVAGVPPGRSGLYRLGGVDEKREQDWLTYTVAMLLFHVGGFLILYILMRVQGLLPFNPAGMTAVPEALTFNTAVSFITNTNWQNYGGESTMSYLDANGGPHPPELPVGRHRHLLAVALIRGFARASAKTVGNFWVDITRCTLYVLIPLSSSPALFLIWQGVPQNLGAYVDATTLEGAKQTMARAPRHRRSPSRCSAPMAAASSMRMLAHPFENPTALSNFLEIL